MNHLTEEQFEELMQGKEVRSVHLRHCIECRGRLTEKQALASRLRLAFAEIKPEKGLAERIRRQLKAGLISVESIGKRPLLKIRFQRRSWLSIASAAAGLIIVISLFFFLAEPSAAFAAQAELVGIHKDNLSADHDEFYHQTDPQKMAEYFERELGVIPIILRAMQGRSLRGGCLCRFRGQIAASYVVKTPQGMMSIVVVTDLPKSLGMERKFRRGKRVFWVGSFADCNLVAVRIGQYSYCAVGEVPDADLTEVLLRLINGEK